jgi:hypothetical protein
MENCTDRTENSESNESSIVACVPVAAETCLPSRYLAKDGCCDSTIIALVFSLRSVPVMTSYNSRGIGDGVFFVVRSRAI